jgi:hypothetical protein
MRPRVLHLSATSNALPDLKWPWLVGVAGVVADGLGARARAEFNALTDSPYWKVTLSHRRKYG